LLLINDIPATLPPVHADESRMQQILHNLIGNAIKFTPAGAIRISAIVIGGEEEGAIRAGVPTIAVSVSDTGIGIPEDKRDRIFESFEQVEGSARRQYGGTGLGLAITRSLLDLHGGQIRVESKVGEGSVFTFTLPVSTQSLQESTTAVLPTSEFARASLPESIPDPMAHLVSGSPEERSTGGLVPRVLIVDDEPVNLQVIKNFLHLEHYHLTMASDGQEALALLEQGLQPDIILLDVMMPKMTGYEVVQAIRQTMLADRLPIILLSARNQPEDIVMGLEVGANDYLTKPIGKEELVARIHTHLQIRQAIDARQKMESELAIAAQIQRSMVPHLDIGAVHDPRYDLAGLFQPARMVGGDLYDFFLLGEDRLYLFIGDVADKGVPAALLMARTVTLIRMLARQTSTAAEILSAVNHELCINNDECQFVTLFCGILNLKTGRFGYASGGHDAPLLVRALEVQLLDLETGPAIGLDEEALFPMHECVLRTDDLLVLFTDGITEAMNPEGDLFSEERLTQTLADCPGMEPTQVVALLQEAHHRFVQETPQSDDLTLLALQYRTRSAEGGEPDAFTCTLPSRVSELEPVKQELTAFLEAHRLPEKALEDALLIVEETLVNIIHHGYAGEDSHMITIRITWTPESLRMTFEDQGRPFNPLTDVPVADGTEDETLRVSGGYGFQLVRALTERIEYRHQESRNHLTLFLPLLSPPSLPS
ncbi:MAG: serine phosphatase RsbU, regulator of sigma subunit, partial [Chthonomonadales bacterium]|nr:serine phosphatase RsbU, regulator of sigma subunit [Chthonomonadales bacterium]